MKQPVFWDLQPPNGATLSLVGSPLGNMTAHSMRIMFPAAAQPQVAQWLRQTADFLSGVPIGQSVQTQAPAALQITQEAPTQAPQSMPQFMQQAAPVPAPVGHAPEQFHAGAPIGHNNVPLPVAYGNGHAHHPAPTESATQPNPTAVQTSNQAVPSHLQPPAPRPAVTHQPMMMPAMVSTAPVSLDEDDPPFSQMMPTHVAPTTQPAPPPSLDGDTERPPAPRRHTWDRQYEIGIARCTNCKLLATGTEEPFC